MPAALLLSRHILPPCWCSFFPLHLSSTAFVCVSVRLHDASDREGVRAWGSCSSDHCEQRQYCTQQLLHSLCTCCFVCSSRFVSHVSSAAYLLTCIRTSACGAACGTPQIRALQSQRSAAESVRLTALSCLLCAARVSSLVCASCTAAGVLCTVAGLCGSGSRRSLARAAAVRHRAAADRRRVQRLHALRCRQPLRRQQVRGQRPCRCSC